jgi:hypothetical protein
MRLFSLLELEKDKIYMRPKEPDSLYKIDGKVLLWKDANEKESLTDGEYEKCVGSYNANEKQFKEVIEKKVRKIKYWRHFFIGSCGDIICVENTNEWGAFFCSNNLASNKYLKSFMLHEFEIWE